MTTNTENIITKAGYAAIVGKPNSGKSTLMNAILGAKLSIVTHKPQTTRKRVLGIHSTEFAQIIFLDNPGMIEPRYELQRSMMSYVEQSLAESDINIYLIDASDFINIREEQPKKIIERLKKSGKPIILAINKIDLLGAHKNVLPLIAEFTELKLFDDIVPISALKNQGIEELVSTIIKYLPYSPFFYDPEQLSSQSERFFISEIIREHIFTDYSKEIPYSTEVLISEFKERESGKWFISAEIIVERDSQKGILIGKGGNKLKQIGEKARKDIEEHLDMPVFLELFVKVRRKWRDNKNMLRAMGYGK